MSRARSGHQTGGPRDERPGSGDDRVAEAAVPPEVRRQSLPDRADERTMTLLDSSGRSGRSKRGTRAAVHDDPSPTRGRTADCISVAGGRRSERCPTRALVPPSRAERQSQPPPRLRSWPPAPSLRHLLGDAPGGPPGLAPQTPSPTPRPDPPSGGPPAPGRAGGPPRRRGRPRARGARKSAPGGRPPADPPDRGSGGPPDRPPPDPPDRGVWGPYIYVFVPLRGGIWGVGPPPSRGGLEGGIWGPPQGGRGGGAPPPPRGGRRVHIFEGI